jgi:hypothetical protein
MVEGWEESHEVERNLIKKYKEKRKLVNHDDYGMGPKKTIITDAMKESMSKTLKEGYRTGRLQKQNTKVVYCFLPSGKMYKRYDTISEALKELNIHGSSVSRNLNGTTVQVKGFRFRESPEELPSIEGFKKGISYNVILQSEHEKLYFYSMKEASDKLKLNCGTAKQHFVNALYTVYGSKYRVFINNEEYMGKRKTVTVQINTGKELIFFTTLQKACDFLKVNRKKHGYKRAFTKYIKDKTNYSIEFDLPTIKAVNSEKL